jgi:uncharacterized membrane protein
MPKVVGTVVGTLLLLPGVAVALVHYLAGSSDTMKVVILAIAAALLVVGWALLGWSKGNIASLGSGRVEGERAIIPAGGGVCATVPKVAPSASGNPLRLA